MNIVIDTNIVFSAILNSQSYIGQILLLADKSLKFYSPKFLQTEIQNHLPKIKKHTKLNESEVHELIGTLYTKIHFLSEDLIPRETLLIADELTYNIDFDDVIFIAMAIHLKCKLWTGDKALMIALQQKGFNKFITTRELKDRLKK